MFTLVFLSGSVSSANEFGIDLVIFNHTLIWGSCPLEDGGHGDFYSSNKFSLGIANNGSQTFKLEKIILTFTILGEECVALTKQQTIKEEQGLPISLFPNSYLIINITCLSDNIRVTITIVVDKTVIEVGEVIAYGKVDDTYDHWEEWRTYTFYTVSHTAFFPSFSLLEFFIILFFFSKILVK